MKVSSRKTAMFLIRNLELGRGTAEVLTLGPAGSHTGEEPRLSTRKELYGLSETGLKLPTAYVQPVQM